MNSTIEQPVEATVSRSTCERYTIRLAKASGWAVIMLDESGGFVSVQSDYGEYSHCWPHHGCAKLKHFLVQIDTDYLLLLCDDGDFDGIVIRDFSPQASMFASRIWPHFVAALRKEIG